MKISALLRAMRIQFWADLRPNLIGFGLLATLLTPAVFSLVALLAKKTTAGVDPHSIGGFSPGFLVAGTFGAFAGMVGMQIMSEMYTERITGNLLRIRTLPHGSLVWALAKTLSASLLVVFMLLSLLIAGQFIVPNAALSATQIVQAIAALMLVILACAPLGFIVGSLIRGVYSMLLASLGWMALMGTSGGPFPLEILPGWLQTIQKVTPFYWGGHLTRAIMLPAEYGMNEVTGSFNPGLAVLILVGWMIGGFILAILLVNTSLKKQSISSLEKIQATARVQAGI